MSSIEHLVKVHFDQRRVDIDQAWLDRRYKFFREYTFRSLMAQRFKDFRIWFCCQQGMQGKVDGLRDIPGAMFSFLSPTPRPGEHLHLDTGADYVYVTRIDSDDLYSRDALSIANACRPVSTGVEASVFAKGYIHNIRDGRVGVYVNPSSPFHTLMVPSRIFRDEAEYNKYPIGDHSVVRSKFPCQVLPHYKFCVLVHGDNFLSTFDYSREAERVERSWSVARFIDQPIVFDVDDYCDEHAGVLHDLIALKCQYPNFRCTLFTIPRKTSPSMLSLASQYDWVELGVHGIDHEPNEELKTVTPLTLEAAFHSLDLSRYARVFRPPGWYIEEDHIGACNRHGFAVALHARDIRLAPLCQHGYYVCDDAKPYWHGHTHNVCGNWLHTSLPMLLRRWPSDQTFATVSESLI